MFLRMFHFSQVRAQSITCTLCHQRMVNRRNWYQSLSLMIYIASETNIFAAAEHNFLMDDLLCSNWFVLTYIKLKITMQNYETISICYTDLVSQNVVTIIVRPAAFICSFNHTEITVSNYLLCFVVHTYLYLNAEGK